MQSVGDEKVSRTSAARQWAARHRVEVLLFVLLWTTYAYFYQGMGDNEAVRIDQLRAFLEDHTFKIDKYFWNTADIVFYPPAPARGSVYPNKAPGHTFLLAPVYGMVRFGLWPLLKMGMPEWVYWHLVTYVLTLGTSGLFAALAGVAMYRVVSQLNGDAYAAMLAVVAVWLGTLLFPFATLFFSHAITASLLVFAFYFLFELRQSDGVRTTARIGRVFLAGLLLSMSVAGEYPAALSAGLLSLYAVWIGWRWSIPGREKFVYALVLAIGLSLGALLLIGYNWTAFGKPFYIAYQSYAQPGAYFHTTYSRGWMGIRWGGVGQFIQALRAIILSPPIGLLYIKLERWMLYANNPVLWLAVPGLVVMLSKRKVRAEGLLVAATIVVYLLFLTNYGASIYDWSGATFLGPRHLIPVLPFLALPLSFVVRKLALLFYPLLAISAFYMLLATATEPRTPIPFAVPARDLFLPDYLHGKLAQNDHRLFDSGQHLLTRDSTAFNLAKLAGSPGRFQLAPLLVWWSVIGGALLFATRKQEPKGARVGTAIIVAFASAIAFAPAIHHALTAPKVTGHGLLGKYYRNDKWSDDPVDVELDPAIDFDWADRMPLQPPFSVEWTGELLVEQPGEYEFTLSADDGALLEIDGRMVVDASHALLQQVSEKLSLEPGLHRIRVRYFNSLFGGSVHLWWQLAGRPRQIVPNAALVPDPLPIGGTTKAAH